MDGEDWVDPTVIDVSGIYPDRRVNQKSIRGDLEDFGFLPEIVTTAEKIFNTDYASTTKRGGRRKKFCFCLAREAYLNQGKIIPPYELIRKFPSLTKNTISRARTEAFDMRTVTRCLINIETINDYIQYYCQKLGIFEYTTKIIQYKDLLNLPRDLNNRPPCIITATIIWMYTECFSIPHFHPMDIFKLEGITEAAVRKLKAMILNTKKTTVKIEDIDSALDAFLA